MSNSTGQAEVLVYLANSFPFKYETVVIKERQTANALKFAVCKKQGITTRFDDYSIYWLQNNSKVKELKEKPYAMHMKWGDKSGDRNKFLFLKTEKQQEFKKTLKATRLEDAAQRGDPIADTIRYLTLHGLEEVGLFRVSGSQRLIREIVTLYEQGGTVTPDMYAGAHNAAGILKLWLREQDILIPPDFTQRLNDLGTHEPNEELCADGISKVFEMISSERIQSLHHLCLFLKKLSLKSDINKMDVKNLTIIFCPIFDISATVFTVMINQLPRIFNPLMEPVAPTKIPPSGPVKTSSIDASPTLRTAAETALIMSSAPPKTPKFKRSPFKSPPKVPPKSAKPFNAFPKRQLVPNKLGQTTVADNTNAPPDTNTPSDTEDSETDPFQMIEGLQSEFAELEEHIANITFDDESTNTDADASVDTSLDAALDVAIDENLFTSVDDLVSTPFSLPSESRNLAMSEPLPTTPTTTSREALSASADPVKVLKAPPRTPKAARPKSFSAFKKLPPRKFAKGKGKGRGKKRGKFRIQGKGKKYGIVHRPGKGRGRGRGKFVKKGPAKFGSLPKRPLPATNKI